MNDVSNNGYLGPQDPTVAPDEYNTLAFFFNQLLNAKWTLTIGQVKSVTGGGPNAPPPVVGVQPMVNQVDGQANPTPHGIINNVPVLRLGGGSCGIVIDPVVGDIGLLATCSNDISAVKQNLVPSNPGSFRTFNPSDSIYLGTLLSAAPTLYFQGNSSGFTFVAGSNTFVIPVEGDITINGIPWTTHIHPITDAPGVSGPPEA